MISASWSTRDSLARNTARSTTGTPTVASVVESPFRTRYDLTMRFTNSPVTELELSIDCEAAWALSADRTLRPVVGEFSPAPRVGRFVIIQRGSSFYRLDLPWAAQLAVSRRSESIVVKSVLRNRQGCGLSQWGLAKLVPPPSTITLSIYQDAVPDPSECPWLEPYPGGAAAALCITDHPDFDSVERLQVLAHAFLDHGVRITKGVFPVGDPRGTKREPGLDDEAYSRSIRLLFEGGTEIAFHGFGPRVKAPPVEECRRRAALLASFSPETWIDHGTGPYLFSRRATLNDGSDLVEFLSRYGIRNYWSYVDLWQNPTVGLSNQAIRESTPLGDFGRNVKSVSAASSVREIPYMAAQAVKNAVGEFGWNAIRSSPLALRTLAEVRRCSQRHKLLVRSSFGVYGLDGLTTSLSATPTWVFDTVLLNYPALTLTPEVLARLVSGSGLAIVHTYLSQVRHLESGGCLIEKGGRVQSSPRFLDALSHIARLQAAADLAVLPFRDLRRSLCAFGSTNLERVSDGWIVVGSDLPGNVAVAVPEELTGRMTLSRTVPRQGGRIRIAHVSTSGDRRLTFV
jgi:hypothetical protein